MKCRLQNLLTPYKVNVIVYEKFISFYEWHFFFFVFKVIHSVDYEDDLDLTYISVTNQNADLRNKVCFYDNSNMKLVREFLLEDDGHQDLVSRHVLY